MPPPRTAVIESLGAAYRKGRPVALLFDFDGTLSPLVDLPWEAALAPGAGPLLESLAALPRVLVGLVSGRGIDDLKPRVPVAAACFVGTSGLEMDGPDSPAPVRIPATVPHLLTIVAARVRVLTVQYPGSWLEVKPLGLTLHYRQVANGLVDELQSAARQMLAEFSESILAVPGPAALEILPDLGFTKGSAVRALCSRFGDEALPVYAGDSDNDLEAFEAAHELGGLTIAVGNRVDYPVSFRVDDPSELIAWLELLLRRLASDAAAMNDAG